MKGSVYIATSVDGFIARSDGGLDWLPGADGGGTDGGDFGYAAFLDSVDCVVMGRGTFETVVAFEPWPYDRPVFVLSSHDGVVPSRFLGRVEQLTGEPGEVFTALSGRGFQHAYVDGGATIRGFLAAGLIEEIIITRVPVLLGEGIPLFGAPVGEVALEHVETRVFASGLVQDRYRVLGGPVPGRAGPG